ncbi:BTB/POZ domain-containing adapter for CUL3-mediated RhoA degradation protein 2, partial [Cichlidogyrus casuarinus]
MEEEIVDKINSYVKLNVGGTLFYTTIGTLLNGNHMLSAMFNGRMELKTDDQGWVLIDRSGKHFGTILNFLRDGSVPLPETRCLIEELLAEARYYCIEELILLCEETLIKIRSVDESHFKASASIVIFKCPNATKTFLSSIRKPVVKLTMNRYNNVFSYTSNSHDSLLRNIECLEKYALMFGHSVVFVKDVRVKAEQNEICEWGFYFRGYRLKSIDCIAIHYSSDKRLIKVEFPESRIHEEMLFLLSVETRDLTDAELMEIALRKGSGTSRHQSSLPTGSATPSNNDELTTNEPGDLQMALHSASQNPVMIPTSASHGADGFLPMVMPQLTTTNQNTSGVATPSTSQPGGVRNVGAMLAQSL